MIKRNMRSFLLPFLTIIFSFLSYSCGNSGPDISNASKNTGEKIKQQEDGTIALRLEKAAFYYSEVDSSNNTAEWHFVVSKPGLFNVWLSSATTDTMNLQYTNSVKINLLDELLVAKPVGDKIILNAGDVRYPWYRADSYMGSVIINEPGEYSIQVTSEKVLPESEKHEVTETDGRTRVMSVILTPLTR